MSIDAAVSVPATEEAPVAGDSTVHPPAGRQPTLSEQDVSWIGHQFTKRYYGLIAKSPQNLHKLYKDDSRLTVAIHSREDSCHDISATGCQDIQKEVQVSFQDSKVVIEYSRAQPSLSGSVLLQVNGQVQRPDEDGPRHFVQVFVLAPQDKGYYVFNDVLTLLPAEPERTLPPGVHCDSLPALVESAATQPAAVEPAAMQSTTVQPAAMEAATVQPATVQPATVDSATVEPAETGQAASLSISSAATADAAANDIYTAPAMLTPAVAATELTVPSNQRNPAVAAAAVVNSSVQQTEPVTAAPSAPAAVVDDAEATSDSTPAAGIAHAVAASTLIAQQGRLDDSRMLPASSSAAAVADAAAVMVVGDQASKPAEAAMSTGVGETPAAEHRYLASAADCKQAAEAMVKQADLVLSAPKKNKCREAKELLSMLEGQLSTCYSADDWQAQVALGLPGKLAEAAIIWGSALAPGEHLDVAARLTQITAFLFNPVLDGDTAGGVHIQLQLIKQCSTAQLLPFLTGALTDAASYLSGQPQTVADIIEAGCSCAKHAIHPAEQCSNRNLQHLRYIAALQELFVSLSSIHPEAGLLATAQGPAAAEQAAALAAALLEHAAWLTAATGGQGSCKWTNSEMTATEVWVQDAIGSVGAVTGQLLVQLYRRLPDGALLQTGSTEQRLLASPAVLHLLLLLIPSLHAASSCSTNSSSSSSSSSSSIDPNAQVQHTLTLEQYSTVTISTSRHPSLLEQYCSCVLQSFGRLAPKHYSLFAGIVDELLAESTDLEDSAAAQCISAQTHLTLLTYALGEFGDSCADLQSGLGQGPRHTVLCLLLVPSMQMLLSIAVQYLTAGQADMAELVLECLELACYAWYTLIKASAEPDLEARREPAAEVQQVLSFYSQQVPVVPSFLQLLLEVMQLVFQQQLSAACSAATVATATEGSHQRQVEEGCSSNSELPAAGLGGLDSGSSSSSSHSDSGSSAGLSASRLGRLLSYLMNAASWTVGAWGTIDNNAVRSGVACADKVPQAVCSIPQSVFEQAVRAVAEAEAASCRRQPLGMFMSAAFQLLLTPLCQLGAPAIPPGQHYSKPYWKEWVAVMQQRLAGVAAAADTAATCAETSVPASISPQHRQLFALLLSCMKLATRSPQAHSGDHWNRIQLVAGGMINKLVRQAGGRQPAAADLPAAAPWLYALARWLLGASLIIGSKLDTWCKSATALTDDDLAAEGPISIQHEVSDLAHLLDAVQYTIQYIQPYSATTAGSDQSQASTQADAAALEAMAAAAAASELVAVVEQWKQGLLPLLEQAIDLLRYMELFDHCGTEECQTCFKCLKADVAAAAAQLDAADSSRDQVQILAQSFLQQLPQQLMAAGEQLCGLLPMPYCCNNPTCGNMSMQSELLLVGGKACVCAGCELARYCGRQCQAAHWQAHKKVCRMVKMSRAAAAAASAVSPASPAS